MIVRDFHPSNTFTWTPTQREGGYNIQVTVRNKSASETAQAVFGFLVTSRVSANTPVITATANPLVALYSAPPCPAGSSMHVRFQQIGAISSSATSWKNCQPGISRNFYVAGMAAQTTYSLWYEIATNSVVTPGPAQSFTTGALAVTCPGTNVLGPPNAQSNVRQSVMLHSYLSSPTRPFPIATDLSGRVIWY